MRRLKKIIAGCVCILSVIAINPSIANAAWRKNNSGWWYTQGNTWATGWKNIDGNWYYFWPSNGYMAQQTTINGYYVNENGAWVDDSSYNVTAAKAERIIDDRFSYNGAKVKCSGLSDNNWIVRVYEENEYKTTNVGWYYVDINSGVVSTKN